MKYLYGFITILLFICSASKAQNVLHYATNANGEKKECLFPEDKNGDIVFTDIINADYSADSIMLVVDDYIQSMSLHDCEVENISKSARSCSYKIQVNIGKQLWGMEIMGSPLFFTTKDASRVKFKCTIEIRDKKYKYTFFDFETNRNTIHGEAKNDGKPNVIHWQRVNSLIKEMDNYKASHDNNLRKTRETLYDYQSQIEFEAALYHAEYNAIKKIENGLKNLNFTEDFVSIDRDKEENECDNIFSDNKSVYPIYSGYLLKSGNNVFLTGGDSHYEQAGIQELKKQIEIDSLWRVTNDINQAHFILRYFVNLEGRDKAYLIAETPDGKISDTISMRGSSESVSDNKEVARSMYLKDITLLNDKKKCKKQILQKFTK